MELLELIAVFILSLFAGFSAGYFVKTSFKAFSFMMGFYVILTALLWFMHIITFTITFDEVYSMAVKLWEHIMEFKAQQAIDLSKHIIVAVIGFVLGFLRGIRQ